MLKKVFAMLDLNGDGTICESEGVAAGRALFGNAHKGQNWVRPAGIRTAAFLALLHPIDPGFGFPVRQWDEMLAYADDDYDGKVRSVRSALDAAVVLAVGRGSPTPPWPRRRLARVFHILAVATRCA
jgi:hypothetical protein